ncbi:hypothetical protein SUDANB150_06987 [Streptomyces sp. enrichment culture]
MTLRVPIHPTSTNAEVGRCFVHSHVPTPRLKPSFSIQPISVHAAAASRAACRVLEVPADSSASTSVRRSRRSSFCTCASETLRTLASSRVDVLDAPAHRISSCFSLLVRCTSLPASAAATLAGSHRRSNFCRTARRSASVRPPRMPAVSLHSNAASRHVFLTAQDEQTSFASRISSSSAAGLGKKRSGSPITSTALAHAARCCQVWSPLALIAGRSSLITGASCSMPTCSLSTRGGRQRHKHPYIRRFC